ncbi:aspartate aminotransferase family protein, partial [Micromonospora chalcea]
GPVELPPELLALAGSLTPEALTPDLVAGLAGGLGLAADAGAPERMAVVNTLLDAAPARLRERLLAEFVGLLQRPAW